MGLRFYFGPYEEEKSNALYTEVIEMAEKNPDTNFLVLVPDQFTMQTQKQLVHMNPSGGIWNIDVLSFGRLNHRIMEEVGKRDIPVLDDTGKSLVLQKVAAMQKEQLPTLGSRLHRQGYIHEVKSALSEFMQYGISAEDVDALVNYSEKRGALSYKLKDLGTLYRGFTDYIQGHFITTEETLDVLCNSLEKSDLIKSSVIILDGFTGFTPIQNRLLQELMRLAKEMIVSISMGEKEDPYVVKGEQELFYLSKKTVVSLEKLAKEIQVSRDRSRDVFIRRDQEKEEALPFLQKHLFGYGHKIYQNPQESVRVFETTDPREEVHQVGLKILRLVHEKKLAYRDIALISGDLESYAPFVETEFARLGIPCFVDSTKGIVLNPMIEYIKSALKLYIDDFSYESVIHYLRCGMCDIAMEQIDSFDLFLKKTGMRGSKKYQRLLTHQYAASLDEQELQAINETRQHILEQVSYFQMEKTSLAKNYVNSLYEFLVANKVQEKLSEFENYFTEQGDLAKAREYAQIYRLVMELLDQIYGLLGEEEISLQEFADILEAGFGEIQVGIIPQNVDHVLVGDMERTRLHAVKVLFFMGANDGNIPRNASKGGIISDMDREFLATSDFELAPTPRQQMFIQRFYLYLNLSKPTQGLYVSYSRMNSGGKSIRHAYLVDQILKMFSGLEKEYPQYDDFLEQVANEKEGLEHLSKAFRSYAAGTLTEKGEKDFYTLYSAYRHGAMEEQCDVLQTAAFKRYLDSPLAKVVAQALYGKNLENSVTRLETFASCAYRYFLQYGLSLKEREEFGFETVDMGNIFHGVLESFSGKLRENKESWFDFSESFAKEAVEECVQEWAASYGDTILYSSARNQYMIKRLNRILQRTVLTLQKQLRQGVFVPEEVEVNFYHAENMESLKLSLSPQEKMYLQGRIDRVDVAEDDTHVYVKVVDYKSGNKEFDFAALYYGLQLQLVVYMNAAVEMMQKKHPDKEVVPAAMLYYHIDDPAIESTEELSPQELEDKILSQLCTKGMVNSSDEVVERLDRGLSGKSSVVPVERKKDGALSSRSSVMSEEEFRIVSDFVNTKMIEIGRNILNGKITQNPYERGNKDGCTYCPYKKVCGFDREIPGCEKRKLTEISKEESIELMQKEGESKWQ